MRAALRFYGGHMAGYRHFVFAAVARSVPSFDTATDAVDREVTPLDKYEPLKTLGTPGDTALENSFQLSLPPILSP